MDGRCDQVWSKTVLDAWHAVQNLRKALLDSLQGQAIGANCQRRCTQGKRCNIRIPSLDRTGIFCAQ